MTKGTTPLPVGSQTQTVQASPNCPVHLFHAIVAGRSSWCPRETVAWWHVLGGWPLRVASTSHHRTDISEGPQETEPSPGYSFYSPDLRQALTRPFLTEPAEGAVHGHITLLTPSMAPQRSPKKGQIHRAGFLGHG